MSDQATGGASRLGDAPLILVRQRLVAVEVCEDDLAVGERVDVVGVVEVVDGSRRDAGRLDRADVGRP
jgi:hypothetical protein